MTPRFDVNRLEAACGYTCCHAGVVPALVLNADFRPLSYYPLSLWSWQGSVKAVFWTASTSSSTSALSKHELRDAAAVVIVAQNHVKPALYPAFTRFTCFCATAFH